MSHIAYFSSVMTVLGRVTGTLDSYTKVIRAKFIFITKLYTKI